MVPFPNQKKIEKESKGMDLINLDELFPREKNIY